MTTRLLVQQVAKVTDGYSKLADAGGVLDETMAIPQTSFTITQGTGTIYEYGNSVPLVA